jgi:hypothetical protein
LLRVKRKKPNGGNVGWKLRSAVMPAVRMI